MYSNLIIDAPEDSRQFDLDANEHYVLLKLLKILLLCADRGSIYWSNILSKTAQLFS